MSNFIYFFIQLYNCTYGSMDGGNSNFRNELRMCIYRSLFVLLENGKNFTEKKELQ